MTEGPLGGPRPFAEPEDWRGINDHERRLLTKWWMDQEAIIREDAAHRLRTAEEQNRIAVKDPYVSDGPGYAGPMIVLLGGAPTIYVVFGVDEDGLIEFSQDSAI